MGIMAVEPRGKSWSVSKQTFVSAEWFALSKAKPTPGRIASHATEFVFPFCRGLLWVLVNNFLVGM